MNVVLMRKFCEFAEAIRLVDLPVFLQYYAFDVIGSIMMDTNFDMMETERDRSGLLHKIKVAAKRQMTFGAFPVLHVILARFIAESSKQFRQLSSKPSENQMPEPFLAELLDLERKGEINEESIFSSYGSNVIAGSGTTATTLSAAFYYIYRNPIVLKKLRDEIDARERAGLLSNPARFKEAQQMSYLQATTEETLSMHPAVAHIFPREVSHNGVILRGYKFPAKFGLEFCGGGSRICLGRNISLLELAKVIPEVMRHFDVRFENPSQAWKLDVGWLT
ncbi:Cytochrome P450 E-class group I [Penicillium waksmanii]|uniref:Cytochrome P450 E-class group I n=1 Tax=Penicillium waksmanii TaxID=69791 RepID=UPI00254839C7|nr:Cytochrome P450 E-class group I [Penicillium waksmanii]KAJ5995872.1 Cytochrome P450 E-class group I [Penicillium waksmanii]